MARGEGGRSRSAGEGERGDDDEEDEDEDDDHDDGDGCMSPCWIGSVNLAHQLLHLIMMSDDFVAMR